jgi:hypothetical protein
MKFSITHCLAGCCPYPVDTLRICRPDLISVNSNNIYIYIYILITFSSLFSHMTFPHSMSSIINTILTVMLSYLMIRVKGGHVYRTYLDAIKK